MRLLAIDDALDIGGAEHVLLRLAQPLADRGIEVVLATHPKAAVATAWRDGGWQAVPTAMPYDRAIRGSDGRVSPLRVLNSARLTAGQMVRVARLAHHVKADVILANSHWTHLDVATASRATGIPGVLYVHDLPLPGIGERLRTLASVLATTTIAVGPDAAAGLHRAVVIPNGVDGSQFYPGPADPQLRAELGAGPDDVLVVLVCRPDPVKQADQAFAALSRLPEVKVAVLGDWDSPQGSSLRAEAERLLADRVGFPGHRSDLGACLRAADLLVHTSRSEGFGLAPAEALSCGLPVVAYQASGIDPVLGHGGGLMVPSQDIDALTEALRSLVASPRRRRALSADGVRVAQRWTLDEQADRVAVTLRRARNRS
ncbi:MAG: glycosyltransferase family 4 protein [Actinomycetia bacterium]|nr:glycosyltransferase family 4 protein [Actinomycetes bacterium]